MLFSGPFEEFEANHPEMVAIDSKGQSTGKVMDFCKFRTN